MKRTFEPPELRRIDFAAKDVLTASGDDEYEGWNPNDPGNVGGSGGEYEGWMPTP